MFRAVCRSEISFWCWTLELETDWKGCWSGLLCVNDWDRVDWCVGMCGWEEPAGGVPDLRFGVDLREVKKAERREAAPVGRKEETEPTLRAATEAGEALAVAVVEGVAD